MPWLVDGDNLLGTSGRRRTQAERRALVVELRRFARGARKRVLVVFDGPDPGTGAAGRDVQFAGSGHSADDRMLQIVREHSDRRGWTVVTSDKSLSDQCRWLGCRVERCDQFRRRLLDSGAGAADEKPDREDDVEFWLAEFDADGD
jgi:predicted RNA-binding protein with PIN domain